MSELHAINPRKGRHYIWPPVNPDREYPSVTTICGILDKPAIPNWAARTAAEFAVDNMESWAKLDDRDAAVDLIKRSPWRHRDRRGAVGTAVHDSILRGDSGWEEGELGGYVAGARLWLEDTGYRIFRAEVIGFNDTYEYAGTTDGLLTNDDRQWALVDWKTGATGPWPDMALQMMGYLGFEWLATRGNEDEWWQHEMPICANGWVVRLTPEGGYKASEVVPDERLWKAFVGARSLRAWSDRGPKKNWGRVRSRLEGKEKEVS